MRRKITVIFKKIGNYLFKHEFHELTRILVHRIIDNKR